MPSQMTLLPAVMKLETQIKIYQNLVRKLVGKYDGAEDFIDSRVKELCLEHGILKEEVRLYIFLCCVYSLVPNAVKMSLFCIKRVLVTATGFELTTT